MEQSLPFATKSIKLLAHGGRLCGRFGQEHLTRLANLGMGVWHQAWNCWVFPLDEFTAWRLIKEFKAEIETCDTQVRELAIAYHEAQSTKTSDSLADIPKLTRSAWMHQRQGYHFGFNLPATMLAMGMGCGKTLTSIGLMLNRDHETNLIVCPKSVIPVWPTEFTRNTSQQFHIVEIIDTDAVGRIIKAENGLRQARGLGLPFVMVINYESLWRSPISDWVKKQLWSHIIFDEVHRIKSAAGKASRYCGTLLRRSKFRLGLTGTPMPHSPFDIYAQYRALDTSIFGTSNSRFKKRYGEFGGFNGQQVTKFINQEEMHFKFEQIAFRVTNEVLDLPPMTQAWKACTLEPKAMKAYRQMEEDLYFAVESGEVTAANALVKILRLQQITSGYVKEDEGGLIRVSTAKQELLSDLLEDVDQDEPIVIFAVFKQDIAAIREELTKVGRSISELSGDKNELKQWQDGETNAIVVQIRSGGVGVDLTRACIQLYYSTSHSMGDYEQSIARIHRPGQTRPVRFIHLVAKGTIDEAIYHSLDAKKDVVDNVLNYLKRKHAA